MNKRQEVVERKEQQQQLRWPGSARLADKRMGWGEELAWRWGGGDKKEAKVWGMEGWRVGESEGVSPERVAALTKTADRCCPQSSVVGRLEFRPQASGSEHNSEPRSCVHVCVCVCVCGHPDCVVDRWLSKIRLNKARSLWLNINLRLVLCTYLNTPLCTLTWLMSSWLYQLGKGTVV